MEWEVLTSHVFFVYNADGSFKCRQRDYDIDILGAEKYSVDAAGCATHREYGYTENDVWKKISSFDYTFKTIDGKDGYFFTGTSNISEGSNLEYDWGPDGNLIRARRNPAIEEEDTYDNGNTIYFFYTPDRNPTFGAPFDITTLVLPSFGFSYLTNAPISGFPYSGHGTATLPDYLNTDKRNMAATFNYEWSRNESKIEKITKTRYPLFDETVVWTDVYTFTYYE